MNRVLGIDFGDVRVGLAVSDESQSLASGHGFIKFESYNELVEKLESICLNEGISELVIGLPLNMNGSKGPSARKAEKLAELLKARTNYKINLIDERLSTVEAAKQIHASNKKVRKGRIDEVAATIILQTFLDGQKTV